MRIQLAIAAIVLSFVFNNCGGSEPAANKSSGANQESTPDASTPSPEASKGALEPDTPTPAPTVEAVTLKPLITEFCKARREKNEAALKRLYSAATLRSLTAAAREDGKSTITEYLESEPVGDKCTVVNERIVGDTGEATVITETYPAGVRWTFVKEGGSWKLTDQSSDFDKVKKGS